MVRLPFIPKEQKFFDLFEESAQNIVKASQALKEMVDSWQFIDSRVAEITELEHRGDTIAHQILSLYFERSPQRVQRISAPWG